MSLLFAGWVLVRRWRAELAPEDWTMFAVALFNLAYFPLKFLVRPDIGHLVQFAGATSGVLSSTSPVEVSSWHGTPCAGAYPAVRRRWTVAVASACGDRCSSRRSSRHPAESSTPPPRDSARSWASRRGTPRLGYGAEPANDPFLLDDVGQVLASADLGVHDVFDFTNSPGLFYYLLPYESPTKFLHVSMAIRDRDQQELIRELDDVQTGSGGVRQRSRGACRDGTGSRTRCVTTT